MTPISPETAFHEWFRNLGFRGRNDLSALAPGVRDQLQNLKAMYNNALANQRQVAIHTPCPPFHFDYIDAEFENALATQSDAYSFIGLTLPLVFRISDVCLVLSQSVELSALFRLRPSAVDYNELQGTLFYVLLSFVVGHEWTHHVHGHLAGRGGALYEHLSRGNTRDLGAQIEELAADGYSAYHTLHNLMDHGTDFMRLLTFSEEVPEGVMEEILLAFFVTAIAGYMFLWPAPDLDSTMVYGLSHPPQAARMNSLILEVVGWSRQTRPALADWLRAHFQELMGVTAEAVLGANGRAVWAHQNAFLRTAEGAAYVQALTQGIDRYRQSWGEPSGAPPAF